VWGTLPLGGVIGGVLGTVLGVRSTLWIAFAGSWLAGWWVFFSPLRHMRDVPDSTRPQTGLETGPETGPQTGQQTGQQTGPQTGLEADRAPGSGIPGHGGGQLPDGAGASLGD